MEPLRVAPLYIAFHGLAGLRPLEPGFKRVEIRPQLGGLEELELRAFTVRGPLHWSVRSEAGARELNITLPPDCAGELVLPKQETVSLARIETSEPHGPRRYRIPAGTKTRLRLSFL